MAYVRWTEEYRVGVTEVDEQHRRLFALVDELHAAMLAGKGKDVLGETIRGLLDYTKTHFATEESYFESLGYPLARAHAAQHQEFVDRVEEFRQGFEEDRMMLSIEVLDFLVEWLGTHIKGNDKAFGPFLNERGVA